MSKIAPRTLYKVIRPGTGQVPCASSGCPRSSSLKSLPHEYCCRTFLQTYRPLVSSYKFDCMPDLMSNLENELRRVDGHRWSYTCSCMCNLTRIRQPCMQRRVESNSPVSRTAFHILQGIALISLGIMLRLCLARLACIKSFEVGMVALGTSGF